MKDPNYTNAIAVPTAQRTPKNVSVPKANSGYQSDPNQMSAIEATPGGMAARRVSGGNPARTDVKTSGIKIRGTGAATKGTMARGPMA
jgi:hypothetical protein